MANPVLCEFETTASTRHDARTRGWTVYATGPTDAMAQIPDAVGTVYRDPHEGYNIIDPGLLLQHFAIRALVPAPIGGYGLYEVIAYYGYNQGIAMDRAVRPVSEQEHPRAMYYIETSAVERPTDIDYDGQPITNTVGEPIYPPVTRKLIDEVYVVEWLELAVNWLGVYAKYQAFQNKVNSAPIPKFLSAPAYSLLMLPVYIAKMTDASPLPDGTASFRWYLVRAKFQNVGVITIPSGALAGEIASGADSVILNQGRRLYKGIDQDTGEPIYESILDANEMPLAEPVNISRDGSCVLGPGEPPEYLIFRQHGEIDFNAFLNNVI